MEFKPGFSVCELGNQLYRVDGAKLPAKDWYASIGAGRYVSIDANGWATHRADLNYPLPSELVAELGQFDLVTDFGTGEHIFNQAQLFATLHDLAKPNYKGFIMIDRPASGWDGHCFYNIQKTLIRDLVAANDYWFCTMDTERVEGHGELLIAVMQKGADRPFRYPNQGKYKAMLAAAEQSRAVAQSPMAEADQRFVDTISEFKPEPPMIAVGDPIGDTITIPHYVTYKVNRIKRGDVLIDLIRQNGWTRGAEIGVLDGKAVFFKLLDEFPELHMIAVDRWSSTDGDYGDLTEVGKAFVAKAENYVHHGRAAILNGNSAEMAEYVGDASLDFVFIDASHDYDSVKADIAAWTPKVKPGGMVLGHDWNPRFPGVARAATEAFGTVELFEDHVWGVRV